MRIQRIWLTIYTTLLFASLVTGCSSVSNTPPPSAATAPAASTTLTGEREPTDAYPYPEAQAYPGPNPGETQVPTALPAGRAPEPIPTPVAGMGVVHGQLYDLSMNTPLYHDVTVYLSRVIPSDNPSMDAVSFDQLTDPSVVPDTEGGFAFGNVPPGRYGIVVQGLTNQYLTRYADDQTKDVIVKVEAGQTTDIGKILSGHD